MKISIVMPSFSNTVLLDCALNNVRSIEKNKYDILVVSDFSPTQNEEAIIAKKYDAQFVALPEWVGYTKVANIGVKSSDSDIVVLVNTDCMFLDPFMSQILEDFEQDEKLAVVGAKLYNTNGTVQHAGGYYVYGRKFINYGEGQTEQEFRNLDGRFYPEEVTGAVFAIRKSVWEEIGGFDEKYVFYNEDPEFCYQSWERGYKVLYDPKVRAIHARGGSSGNDNSKLMVYNIQSNQLFSKRAIRRNWNKIQKNIYEANRRNEPDPGVFLIERLGERGDLIILTETIGAIREHYPEHQIIVRTNYPEVFRGNPDVNQAGWVESPCARKLDLNVSAEKHLNSPMSYGHWYTITHECGLDIGEYRQRVPVMYSDESDFTRFRKKTEFKPKGPYAVIHQPITNFRSKTLPFLTWARIQEWLESIGLQVVICGTEKDQPPLNRNMMDMRGRTDLQELRELIKHAALFIGVDSGPANICQTTDTPGVVIFTSTDPMYTLSSGNVVPVSPPKGKCSFCQQRQIPPCGYIDCPDHNNYECAKSIRLEDIKKAVEKLNRKASQ